LEKIVKYNFGCGDKILSGYINVDTMPSRRGLEPDILTDLKDIQGIDRCSADEILAVHVIEHFYYWEAVPLLSHWRGFLKPGGKLILECPNLLHACQTIVEHNEIACMPDQSGQMSMWPLYGDPAWKDPLMCHKWGYTPKSLAIVLAQAGFQNIKQEPAQFKLREPRDMRITGIKQKAAQA
jgi:hypothetical protein